jgi:hypothetical protein
VGSYLHDYGSGTYRIGHYRLDGAFQQNPFTLEDANSPQVFVAWLAGARFDIAYVEAKKQFGELLGWGPKAVETVTEVHVASGKSEL